MPILDVSIRFRRQASRDRTEAERALWPRTTTAILRSLRIDKEWRQVGLAERIPLYQKLEAKRKRPLIVYVTSTRPNAEGQIGQDAIAELLTQLQQLPVGSKALDFLIVSNGGDPTVAWRFVSLIRERVDELAILVPQSAYSAATLIALGANEIVLHPNGNLGPTDPQIINHQKGIRFGAEDVQAFLRFVRKDVGLTDQTPVHDLFLKFCEEVGFTGIGTAARGSQLSTTMGEKMLRLHMKDTAEHKQSPRAISEALNTKYFHHGYPLSKKEAQDAGLPVAPADDELESVMWSIWHDIELELKIREPFMAMDLFRQDPNCQAIFAPVPQLSIPPGSSPQEQQMIIQMFAHQAAAHQVPPTRFEFVTGVMESLRYASRSLVSGSVFAARQHDLNMRINLVPEKMGWSDVAVPAVPVMA
jgi:hypothetical protein